jgi:hypothetical protein
MALLLKKDDFGKVYGKIKYNPNLILVKRGFRIIDGHKIEITHFLNCFTRSSYWVADTLQTNILANLSEVKNGVLRYDGGRRGQVKARYIKPIILAIHDWEIQGHKPQLLNHMGEHLSGTNIYGETRQVDSYGLCLGTTYDYLNLNLFDALLYTKANTDLGWKGPQIQGESKFTRDENNKKVKVFEIENWSTICKCKQPLPEEILGYASALVK